MKNTKDKVSQDKPTAKSKASGTLKGGFVLSILALIFCVIQAPQLGLLLAVIAVGLLIPEIIKAVKGKSLPSNGTGKFISGCIMTAIALVMGVVGILPKSSDKPKVTQEYSNLRQLDLNGEVVSVACEKLRGEGWQILEVAGKKTYATKSDCSDTDHKVASLSYHTEKYSTGSGAISSSYEKVTIYFNDQDDNSSSSSSSSSSDNNSSSSNSNSSSSSNNNSSSSSSSNNSSSSSNNSSSSSTSNSSTDVSFRKAMDEYESFMNRYVDFMKKYKNSSDVTSMHADYSKMMQDYAKFADSIRNYNQSNLSAADWAYYLEVTARVNKKLLEVQ